MTTVGTPVIGSVGLFCGSSPGVDPDWRREATAFGRILALAGMEGSNADVLARLERDFGGNDRTVEGVRRLRELLDVAKTAGVPDGHMPFVSLLTIFALACFVGYYVVWRVTPALHSPLMSVTNAVSSVIIVGAILAAGLRGLGAAQLFGAIAVALAAVNIFGGFIVTHRMLSMFKKKPVKK